jgi:hypothetical protein
MATTQPANLDPMSEPDKLAAGSRPATRARLISAVLGAWIVVLALSDARAERPFSVFLLPPLIDDLIDTALPFQVKSDFGQNSSIRFWIVESRYCGASADHAGKFVAIAVPDPTRESGAPRTLDAEDCPRGLNDLAKSAATARRAQPWVAAVSLRAVWKSSRLQWKLTDARFAGDGVAPAFSIPRARLTIAEIETSDIRVAIDNRLDMTVQLATAFFEDSARLWVSRAPLKSAPKAGSLDHSLAPSATRAIAELPNDAVNSIFQQDLIQQELVFDHKVSGEQRFLIQKASVASPDSETYTLSGQSVHVGTEETFSIDVVFRGDDLLVESMTLEQQLDDCGDSPPVSEFEAWTAHTECAAEFALRRGVAEVGSALLTKAYQRHALRPTGAPTSLQVWIDGHHLTVALSILKASVHGDALALYLEPTVSRAIDAP